MQLDKVTRDRCCADIEDEAVALSPRVARFDIDQPVFGEYRRHVEIGIPQRFRQMPQQPERDAPAVPCFLKNPLHIRALIRQARLRQGQKAFLHRRIGHGICLPHLMQAHLSAHGICRGRDFNDEIALDKVLTGENPPGILPGLMSIGGEGRCLSRADADAAFAANPASGALRAWHHLGFEQNPHQVASGFGLKEMAFPVLYDLNVHGVGLLVCP